MQYILKPTVTTVTVEWISEETAKFNLVTVRGLEL